MRDDQGMRGGDGLRSSRVRRSSRRVVRRLYHLRHGELRDADHWAHQAITLDTSIHIIPTAPWPHRLLDSHRELLREAVERLKVDEVAGAAFHHPDHRLANKIEELADAH
jgi:hypothetical protein